MKIVIDYEASWRNSFLDGVNDEPLPKKGRNFVASMDELRKSQNFIPRQITNNTVMGVLHRLIGDQRKLYQSKSESDGTLPRIKNYFADIENSIAFEDNPRVISQEIAYIRNMKGSTKTFTGMIRVNDPIFQSDYSSLLWGVLGLEPSALFDFILENRYTPTPKGVSLNPLGIMNILEKIKKLKPVDNQSKAKEAAEYLQTRFEEYKPLNSKGEIILLAMYCSALYLQLERLGKIYCMQTAKSKAGKISGISKNGFTPKDFMYKYTTGPRKLIYGNPYVREETVKGKGKIKHLLSKASGQLIIHLNIPLERAVELKTMIDNAGVSAFYLGKKGLAYVSHIDIR